jgi:hypothetical protein
VSTTPGVLRGVVCGQGEISVLLSDKILSFSLSPLGRTLAISLCVEKRPFPPLRLGWCKLLPVSHSMEIV